LERLRIQEKQSGCDEDDQRDELADRECVTNEGCLSDSQHIDDRQCSNNQDDDRRAPDRRCRTRPKETQVIDQQVAVRSERCDTGQPEEPADLESDRGLISLARVEIWPTSFFKTAADFREAKDDERDDERAGNEGDNAVSAD